MKMFFEILVSIFISILIIFTVLYFIYQWHIQVREIENNTVITIEDLAEELV